MLLYEASLLAVVLMPIDETELESQLSRWRQSVLGNGRCREFRFSTLISTWMVGLID